jgi:formylglycine-generating enzyme
VKSKNYKYSGNDQIKKIAWFSDNSIGKGTNIVGSIQPNEIGIYDMSGNVWEWCQDYSGDYYEGHQLNPKGTKWGLDFIIRGGSFATDKTECRVSNRNHCSPDNPGFYGFRIVLSDL